MTQLYPSRQVGLGLDAIHAQGFVHRDIKAANILVAGSGDFKVADLGIAVPPPLCSPSPCARSRAAPEGQPRARPPGGARDPP